MGERAMQELAVQDVLAERERQDAKWGEQNHDPFTWGAILTEEVGEWQKEALGLRFGPSPSDGAARLREEAVQVAAVALAIVECIDRATWRWGVSGLAAKRRAKGEQR